MTAPPDVNGCFFPRLMKIARERGLTPDHDDLAGRHRLTGDTFPMDRLVAVAADCGLSAEPLRLPWNDLGRLRDRLPALIVFRDHSTAILDALDPASPGPAGPTAILIREEPAYDPKAPPAPEAEEGRLPLEADDLGPLWLGDVVVFSQP